jgi:hypothetical protein
MHSKFHPRTGKEGPDRELRYSSTFSLTSALDGVGDQRHVPTALPPRKKPGNHCTGGWVWTDAKNLSPTGILSPNSSSP